MIDLSKRSYQDEIMDDLNDGSESLYQALYELDVINKWLGGNEITENALFKILLAEPDKKWRIADVGCGSGNILCRIAEKARKHDVHVELIGFDANPNVIEYARKHCKAYPEIELISENIQAPSFKNRKFDVILTTLFLHHFNEATLTEMLKEFQRQSKYIIINDLHRHWFAYYSIKWITLFFSKSTMVKNDACLSVWRAFKKSDLNTILKDAGIQSYSLKWRWAFRWEVVIG